MSPAFHLRTALLGLTALTLPLVHAADTPPLPARTSAPASSIEAPAASTRAADTSTDAAITSPHAAGQPDPASSPAPSPASAPLPPQALAHLHSNRPQLGTGVAFAPDGSLWQVAVNGQGKLFVQTAHRRNSGPDRTRTWQWEAPRLLDTGSDRISADGENRPKLLFGPRGLVIIAYTQPLDKPFTGFIRMLRSVDGGKTFSAPRTVHADRQIITHRFESLAFDARGVLHTVWIDKRDLEAAPRIDGRPDYRGAAIYHNVSRDGGASFGPDMKLADHSCECCHLALATGTDGRMRAMWRHVFEPNIRDHAFAVLASHPPSDAAPGRASRAVSGTRNSKAVPEASAPDAARDTPSKAPWQAPAITRATFDDWHIDACPHHGPALAPSPDGGFHTVWFGIREEGDRQIPGVRYARLGPDGRPDAATVRRLPDTRAEHADMLAHDQRVAIVWRSARGRITTLKAWLSRDGGRHFDERTLDETEGDNDFPRLAQQGLHFSVAWRTPQETRIHDLDF